MFEDLTAPQPDKIIRLMGMFAADPRPTKVDLGVGVYRDDAGVTPVMAAVKDAEQRIWEEQTTKGYVGFLGDPDYVSAMRDLVLGDAVDAARVGGSAATGGTGAIRQLLEMAHALRPDLRVWVPQPSWPNHAAILSHLGIERCDYRFYHAEASALDAGGMMADLAGVAPGDLVLIHGCCHNPTGAEMPLNLWRTLADHLADRGVIPLVDIAYQGFGAGLREDTEGLRALAAHVPEMMIAASCSKNFGLYRERVGVSLIVTDTPKAAEAAAAMLGHMNRVSISFPPDHGARVVTQILNTPDLRLLWEQELNTMRRRVETNRRALAEALRAETGSDRFGFVAAQRGMFSLMGITEAEVETLRDDHAVYMVQDSRVNLAGLSEESIPAVARAIATVVR